SPPDLWVANARFDSLRRLTNVTPRLAEYRLGHSQVVDFSSSDGHRLQGALLLPPHYSPGKRYPMVVWVYPGVFGATDANKFGLGDHFGYNMQLLATRGYVVLNPDIPIHPGTIRADIFKAVMPAVDRVVSMGIADPDRLALMGSSFGGYATI